MPFWNEVRKAQTTWKFELPLLWFDVCYIEKHEKPCEEGVGSDRLVLVSAILWWGRKVVGRVYAEVA